MNRFNDCISECGLTDIGFRGHPFTWTNHRFGITLFVKDFIGLLRIWTGTLDFWRLNCIRLMLTRLIIVEYFYIFLINKESNLNYSDMKLLGQQMIALLMSLKMFGNSGY